jgi:hypothetical protein
MGYKRLHWSIFNIWARVVGIGFGITSVVGIVSGFGDAFYPQNVANRPEGPTAAILTSLGLGLFLGLLSFALLRIRPYRPDLDPTLRLQMKSQPATLRQSWWTGLPKS